MMIITKLVPNRFDPSVEVVRTAIGGKLRVHKKWIFMIFADKFLQSLTDLAHVVDTLNLSRPLQAARQSWQHERRKNSNDGNNNQQFNQGESFCGLGIDFHVWFHNI